VATRLLEVYFCALSVTYRTSGTLKVIEVFPDESVDGGNSVVRADVDIVEREGYGAREGEM